MAKCEFGTCRQDAKWQTYFLGGKFLKLCKTHEAEVFPERLFRSKDYRRRVERERL